MRIYKYPTGLSIGCEPYETFTFLRSDKFGEKINVMCIPLDALTKGNSCDHCIFNDVNSTCCDIACSDVCFIDLDNIPDNVDRSKLQLNPTSKEPQSGEVKIRRHK